MEIWDGLTPRRPDLSTTRATSHEDFLVIVNKIQELQAYALNLASNLQVMPNLEGALKAAKERINEVQDFIDSITLPEDVKDRLDAIEQNIEDIDQRTLTLQLKRDLEFLKEKVARNQIEVLNLQSSFETEVKGFQNKVWGTIKSLQTETAAKLTELTEKVTHIDAQVDLQARLDALADLRSK
jgi:hypothetical protein